MEAKGGDVILQAGKDWHEDGSHVPIPASIRLSSNGEIFVNDKLAATDAEVVEGLRMFLRLVMVNMIDPMRERISNRVYDLLLFEYNDSIPPDSVESFTRNRSYEIADIVLRILKQKDLPDVAAQGRHGT